MTITPSSTTSAIYGTPTPTIAFVNSFNGVNVLGSTGILGAVVAAGGIIVVEML
jgi:hypothetical protein